jgi:ankyrin repeat protein
VIIVLLVLLIAGCARPAPPPQVNRAAELVRAVRDDSTATIRQLLGAGLSPDTLAPDGTRPLTEAARNGRVAAARLLLDADARSDLRDSSGASAMDDAVEYQHRDIAILLVEHAAQDAGESPAVAAWFDSLANKRSLPADWRRLLDGELTSLALLAAVIEGRGDMVSSLRHAAGVPNRTGYTPLLVAARTGDETAVIDLLEAGANPDAEVAGHLHETPLMEAARDGYVGIAHRLIRAGAHVDHLDATRQTALMWAVREGETDYARALLQAGAQRGLRNRDGETALDIAKRINHGDLITVLAPR